MSNIAIALVLTVVGLLVFALASGVWDTIGIVLMVLGAVFLVLALVRGDRTNL